MSVEIIRAKPLVVGENKPCACGRDRVFYLREDTVIDGERFWRPICWIQSLVNSDYHPGPKLIRGDSDITSDITIKGDSGAAKSDIPPSRTEPTPELKPAQEAAPVSPISDKSDKPAKKSRKATNIALIMGGGK